MAQQSDVQLLNETLFEQLNTPGMEKTAIDAINDFTRTKMREDGYYRRIIPPLKIDNSELDRQVDTPKPVKVVDKEADSPAAISIPFRTLPINVYIRGNRYRVMFSRIATPRFMADVDELRTYVMDIRQVLGDNSLKDMMAEEDTQFTRACNAIMLGPDVPVPYNGNNINWQTLAGGIDRENLEEALKIMPRGPSHLEVHTILINNVSIKEVMKFGRDEMGGDFSQQVLKDGWAETQFLGCKWIITIKRDLVPDDTIFMFADPKFIGKNYLLEDTTMHLKREFYLLEFFSYQTAGGSLGHAGGICRADFA